MMMMMVMMMMMMTPRVCDDDDDGECVLGLPKRTTALGDAKGDEDGVRRGSGSSPRLPLLGQEAGGSYRHGVRVREREREREMRSERVRR